MKYIFFDTINSTNTYLKNNYEKLEHFTIVCANHQTSGKGRLGRIWIDNDDLLFSILLKDNLKNYPNYSLLIAYSIMKVLKKRITNHKISIKWPNDIMIDDKKICGILLEGISKEKTVCVVIGCGINVNSENFSDELRVKATSLKNILNKKIEKLELLEEIINQFNKDYQEFLSDKSPYIEEINNNFYLKDKEVIFVLKEKNCTGIASKVNSNGEIVIKTENEDIKLSSGEISLESVYKVK